MLTDKENTRFASFDSKFTRLIFESLCESLGKPHDSTSILEALTGKLDIKRHSPSILIFTCSIIAAMMKVKRSNSWSYEDFSFEDYRFAEDTPTDPKERVAETERQQHENFCR